MKEKEVTDKKPDVSCQGKNSLDTKDPSDAKKALPKIKREKKDKASFDPSKDAERVQQANKLMDLFDQDEVKEDAQKKVALPKITKIVTIDSDPMGNLILITLKYLDSKA